MRQRVRLVNLKLGDPDDIEIYAGAAVWDWIQRPEFERLKTYNITMDQMYWTHGPMAPHSITVDVWADVEEETAILLKLSGLCQL
ncbi:hypothetical protein UFOVP71_155 [uncultured Caudovirales phage]|uniref:Uncharacterized protein n=1 Tax=uncultured Caudovirales phage TaxID=2100421 RepID=A0A6J5TCE7_9CAUD|nr:hypothetical protein UFOVP71_155 [uncultured Caudovirales phage]